MMVSDELSDDLGLAIYEQMVLAREFDRRMIHLQREGLVAAHSTAIGEEGAIVGAAAAMSDEDWVFPGPREVAAALWRGLPPVAYVRHALGLLGGPAGAHASTTSPFWKAARVASTSPLPANQLPHAAGLAWAAHKAGRDVVALVFLGDGATSSSSFHAGMTTAAAMRAPIVVLCRNNGRAVSTPVHMQTASVGLAIKAAAYGVTGVCVDGGDAMAVFAAVRAARARASAGGGATFIEALTVPQGDEDGIDDGSAGESLDPLSRMRGRLEMRGVWTDALQARLLADVRDDVDRAVAEARSSAGPAPASLLDHVYAERR